MSKFNQRVAPVVLGPVRTTGERAKTHEGGVAWKRDAKSDLMLLAVTNMVGEDTFYESAGNRDDRYVGLVRQVAVEDYEWMKQFISWLRNKANMRSASVVAACEAVRARLDAKVVPAGRELIDAACARADEPGEVLAYWKSRYGGGSPKSGTRGLTQSRFPKPVKRGVADAAARLYTERNWIKWDSAANGMRFGDVIDIAHVQPSDDRPWQSDLFKYILDKRHNRDVIATPVQRLRMIAAREELLDLPVAERRAVLLAPDGADRLYKAGMTWESVAGWLQGPMDAKAWEAIIPSMGAMALARNLRNFDQAGIGKDAVAKVVAKLTNPEDIRQSKMFPYRMLSAYLASPSDRYKQALNEALEAACQNVPELPGCTLVLVDTSGSMTGTVSAKSKVQRLQVGVLIGAVLAMKGSEVDLYGFATDMFQYPLDKAGSLLGQIQHFTSLSGCVGHGTNMVPALEKSFKRGRHQRVVIVSDMQAFSSGYGGRSSVSEAVPADVPMFGVNLAGYDRAVINTSVPNRFEIGGFSDAMFPVMDLLSRGFNSGWPWEL